MDTCKMFVSSVCPCLSGVNPVVQASGCKEHAGSWWWWLHWWCCAGFSQILCTLFLFNNVFIVTCAVVLTFLPIPQASASPNDIWKLMFFTPEPKVMLLNEAKKAGYGVKSTEHRLVLRSPFNSAETYIENVSNCPQQLVPAIIIHLNVYSIRWLGFPWKCSVLALTMYPFMAWILWILMLPVRLVSMFLNIHVKYKMHLLSILTVWVFHRWLDFHWRDNHLACTPPHHTYNQRCN